MLGCCGNEPIETLGCGSLKSCMMANPSQRLGVVRWNPVWSHGLYMADIWWIESMEAAVIRGFSMVGWPLAICTCQMLHGFDMKCTFQMADMIEVETEWRPFGSLLWSGMGFFALHVALLWILLGCLSPCYMWCDFWRYSVLWMCVYGGTGSIFISNLEWVSLYYMALP